MRLAVAVAGIALVACASVAQAAADPARYMPTEIMAESTEPRPGTAILVGFRMLPKPGWHGYWSNPGDSGITPTVTWNAPQGVSFGPLLHPAPSLLIGEGISSFVHEGPHILLSRMTVARSVPSGTEIPVKAELSWAACTATLCVPLHATFTLDLVAGNGVADPDSRALNDAMRRVPISAPSGTYSTDGAVTRLVVPPSLRLNATSTHFFPDENGLFSTSRGKAAIAGDKLTITAPASSAPRERLTGVLTDGRQAFRIAFDAGTPLRAGATAGGTPAESHLRAEPTPHPIQPDRSAPLKRTRQSQQQAQPAADRLWLAVGAATLIGIGGVALALRRRYVRRRGLQIAVVSH